MGWGGVGWGGVGCHIVWGPREHMPSQIGDMDSLQDLDVRRNLLVELPPGKNINQVRLKIFFPFTSSNMVCPCQNSIFRIHPLFLLASHDFL